MRALLTRFLLTVLGLCVVTAAASGGKKAAVAPPLPVARSQRIEKAVELLASSNDAPLQKEGDLVVPKD